ncbi:MAG: SDR family NAD(P)-dependent oxidoreductase [Candidatus Auribacter fodinae]|uniref:SDR family NAD(P)-dependent oxidoreductase n=1 Tax=Candidatus Auribacter fodinae TaxID=2093366 RepID=A0A3A4RCC5_9BACT|nr:MAG: SDR family NAD(P)-dependent oxidoreductase [Candidatus Auribacter fodinae]
MPDTRSKAIVIGASSGIGYALVKELSARGYTVGMASRRLEPMKHLQNELKTPSYIRQMDVSDTETACITLRELICSMQGADMIIINSGVRIDNRDFLTANDLNTIAVNVCGFIAMAHVAVDHFIKARHGSLVGISSIAGLKGSALSPAYNASKACISNYMSGLRQKCREYGDISVTDIRPGFVDTPMVADIKSKFWVASPEKAARQIIDAALKKKKVAYVTKRWKLLAIVAQTVPENFYSSVYRKFRR